MSGDAVDKWLDALRFEIYRLQFTPNRTHAKILESQIQELESQPVAEIGGNDLNTTIHNLEALKQDLASVQHLIDLVIQLRNLRDEMREKGFLSYNPNDADEVFNGFHAWFEKAKIEQRKRQWRNLAHLRHFWPKADGPRRRQMVELFATYGRQRLKWGIMNIQIGTPLKIGLWMLVCALTTSALAIASHGTIVTAANQTRGESTLNLTPSEPLLNKTLTPSQNYIIYRVPNSHTTLLFHHLGRMIPVEELLRSVAFAVRISYTHIAEGQGQAPMANHGYFKYKHVFLNLDEVEITVADFRENGKVMTYFILFDVVSGVGQFMISPGQVARELEFEVDVDGVGYVGTGHVYYKNVEAPAASVA